MIRTKADNELEYMREAGKIVALAHQAVKDAIKALSIAICFQTDKYLQISFMLTKNKNVL